MSLFSFFLFQRRRRPFGWTEGHPTKCCALRNLLTLACRNDERRLARSRPTSGHYRSSPPVERKRNRHHPNCLCQQLKFMTSEPKTQTLFGSRRRRWRERIRTPKSHLPPATESIRVIVSHLSSAPLYPRRRGKNFEERNKTKQKIRYHV